MSSISYGNKDRNLVILFASLIAFAFALGWQWLPNQDPAGYFDFADKRSLWGIPNFFDVGSNFFFALVGAYGLIIFVKAYSTAERSYLFCFLFLSLGVFFTSFGSGYFHWNPKPETLFWDRLPMAVGFSSLLTMFLVDHLAIKNFRSWLVVTNLLSIFAVVNISWALQDLRPYIVVQFGFLILILLMAVVINKGRIPRKYLLLGMIFYVLAKVLEVLDLPIFEAVGMSGHTLKHIAAATAVLYLNQGMYKFFFTAR